MQWKHKKNKKIKISGLIKSNFFKILDFTDD